jgi:hypothetical protein
MTVEDRMRLLVLIEKIDHCTNAQVDSAVCKLCPACEANLALIKDLIEREDD